MNPATGAALRPFDNVGVQYGLNALNSGAITTAQFLDLNEQIGGVDRGRQLRPERERSATWRDQARLSGGLMLGGNGGLTSIPIFDNATSNEAGGYHYGWFHFALRERVRQANGGSSDNMVMWRATSARRGHDAVRRLDGRLQGRHVEPIRSASRCSAPSPRAASTAATTRRRRRASSPTRCRSRSKPVSKCSELYPVYSNPRREAGGPLAANILKCQLKPIDADGLQDRANRRRAGAAEGDLPRRRLRLVEARRQPGAGRDLGVVRTVAEEPGL